MTTIFEQLNNEMSAIVEKARCSLVEITNGQRGLGAGTIWHSDGLIFIRNFFQGYAVFNSWYVYRDNSRGKKLQI